MKLVLLLCSFLILVVNCSLADGFLANTEEKQDDSIIDLTVDLELHFDVTKLYKYDNDMLNDFVNIMRSQAITYFGYSSLRTSLKINVQNSSLVKLPCHCTKNNREYLMDYCREVQTQKSRPFLTILFTDQVAPTYDYVMKRNSKVYTYQGGYCDTSKDCAIIEFRTWPENAFNLARAIASSVGVDFDDSLYSECHTQDTIMTLRHSETGVGLPYKWSPCSRRDLERFLESDEASCIRKQTEILDIKRNKVKIYVKIQFDNPKDSFYINWNELKDKINNETAAYFTYNKLDLPIELVINFANDFDGKSFTNDGPDYLKHYCSQEKLTDPDSKSFSVLISAKDLYNLDTRGKKDYYSMFFTDLGNHCDQSNNCAIIEHSAWKTDIFNLARVIARSLGITFDGSENNRCNDEDTIMAMTYNKQNLPTKWSQCSRDDFEAFMMSKNSACLHRPRSPTSTSKPTFIKVNPTMTSPNEPEIPSTSATPMTSPNEPEIPSTSATPSLNGYKVDIEIHFLQQIINNSVTSKDFISNSKKILEDVQLLLRRRNLNLDIKLNLVDIKLFDVLATVSQYYLNAYCNQQAQRKSYSSLFTVLFIENINSLSGYIFNRPWQVELYAHPRSMCDKKKSCAVMYWNTASSASSLARALALSLGAPIDSEQNDCTDDTIMLPGPSFVDRSSEWSKCTQDGIMSYLNSEDSYCLKGERDTEVKGKNDDKTKSSHEVHQSDPIGLMIHLIIDQIKKYNLTQNTCCDIKEPSKGKPQTQKPGKSHVYNIYVTGNITIKKRVYRRSNLGY